ncbi:MAG: hypothetical protein CMJ90_01775 [Planctomycetes bacterium]|nr:hypothetical protein [Planctomycetota bacterium]
MSRTKLIMLSLLAILALFTFVPIAFGQSADAEAQPVRATAAVKRTLQAPADQVKVFSLKNARAADLSQVLQSLFRRSRTVAVVPDPRTNALVLSGTQDELEQIADLLDTLDSKSTTPVEQGAYKHETSVIVLRNRRAQAVGMLVSELYARRASTTRGRGSADRGDVRIVIDEELNAIVAQASSDAMKNIKGLITQLDVPVK